VEEPHVGPGWDAAALRAAELAADRLLLGRASLEEFREVSRLLPPPCHPHLFELLASPPEAFPAVPVEPGPAVLGSYLSSRLLRRGFRLSPDVTDCMYALADAVKAVSAVKVLRWRFVLDGLLRSGARNSAAARLLRQTGVVLETLSELSGGEELEWERTLLGSRPL